ncbi:MAG: efflux RND transporter permease subunit [bacterium]|nr:efflux RND transporter permease subunit [bacterium]
MKIVEFSLHKRVTVSMIVIVIMIFGGMSYFKLGLDMMPDLEAPYISIITEYPGVSSEDIEQNVTRPLEQWVSAVSRVKEIKSVSREGSSVLMVKFESGANLDFAAQDVREKIGLFENFLPEGANNPLVLKFNINDTPILMYGITSINRDLKGLKNYIDLEVATRLERLDGVASAIIFSPEEAEILIEVDKSKLEARGLSIRQVGYAIRASNINLPSGYIDESHKEYLIRTIGEFKSLDEIEQVVITTGKQGQPVFLRDLARVIETSKEIRSRARINGSQGLMLIITKSAGANTVLVAQAVKDSIEKITPTLDKDLELKVALDFSRIIRIMANRSANNILSGAILAMLLILAFLRSLRPTLAIGIAIPLSVITTFIALHLVNYTLNLITMGGLALGVGMLVDNAIVVIENIFRHLEDGRSPYDAARIGTSEVGTAIIASTLTTIAVFFPMIFASGVAGKLSQGLAVSVSFALLSSLFIALTIIPMLASWLFKAKSNSKEFLVNLGMDKFSRLRDFYKRTLEVALKRRIAVLLLVLTLFIGTIILSFFLGSEFLPNTDDALIFLKLKMPVGTRIEETDRILKLIEKQSLNDKNVISTLINVGVNKQNAQDSALGFNPSGSNEANLWAYLTTGSKREVSDVELLEQWRNYFPNLQRGKIEFIDITSITMMGESSTSPIECNIYGKELEKLGDLAQKVKAEILNIEGIRDVEISLEKSKPEIKIKIKKEEASKLGLTPFEISKQVETYTIGTVVSRIILEEEEREIRVRLQKKDRTVLDKLKKLPIITPMGTRVYLSQVVEFKRSLSVLKIERENQVRKVSITANYIDRDLGGIVTEIIKKTAAITNNLPEGYFSHMGGAYEDMLESYQTMALALFLAVVLVYAVMASQFESLKYPFIIMFTIPLALIGVVLLLAITGKNISLPSIMGFIMLGGIVVNNGIVMVDYINQLIVRGFDRIDAVVNGAVVRLRPILITALSTIFGMLPMAISTSEGFEIRSPMAIALIGGLVVSTFLTLFVIPILYTYFSKIKTTGN